MHVIDEENSWGDIDVIYLNFSRPSDNGLEEV